MSARERFKVGACYLVPVLKRFYGVETNHMRVYQVMKEEGLLYSKAETRVRKRWVRWEREFSNELWHVDWHQMKDPPWNGMWLVVHEDDASRRIMSHAVFEHPTSPHSVEVLTEYEYLYSPIWPDNEKTGSTEKVALPIE